MGGTKDLTGKCEEYASELLSKTGKIVEKDQICNQLNMGGKHAIVIDIFSTGGRNCIKERSVIHGVGVMDPAPRAGKAWKEVFEEVGSRCVGRGTKGFPVTFEFDQLDEDRIVRLHIEYKRQLDEIYRMKGNITTTDNKSVNVNAEKQYRKINNKRSLGNAVGDKRTRNNNNKTVKKPKIIQPELRTAAIGAARSMNVINLTKNNNNNRSLTQLAEQNTRYYQQIQDVKKRLRRPHLVKNPAKFPSVIAQLKQELKRLRILRQEGLAAIYKKRGDTNKERKARDRLASLKKMSP